MHPTFHRDDDPTIKILQMKHDIIGTPLKRAAVVQKQGRSDRVEVLVSKEQQLDSITFTRAE